MLQGKIFGRNKSARDSKIKKKFKFTFHLTQSLADRAQLHGELLHLLVVDPRSLLQHVVAQFVHGELQIAQPVAQLLALLPVDVERRVQAGALGPERLVGASGYAGDEALRREEVFFFLSFLYLPQNIRSGFFEAKEFPQPPCWIIDEWRSSGAFLEHRPSHFRSRAKQLKRLMTAERRAKLKIRSSIFKYLKSSLPQKINCRLQITI